MMLCGNDPAARARMQPGDRAALEWFDAWLRWAALPDDQRAATPAPISPAARRVDGPDTTNRDGEPMDHSSTPAAESPEPESPEPAGDAQPTRDQQIRMAASAAAARVTAAMLRSDSPYAPAAVHESLLSLSEMIARWITGGLTGGWRETRR